MYPRWALWMKRCDPQSDIGRGTDRRIVASHPSICVRALSYRSHAQAARTCRVDGVARPPVEHMCVVVLDESINRPNWVRENGTQVAARDGFRPVSHSRETKALRWICLVVGPACGKDHRNHDQGDACQSRSYPALGRVAQSYPYRRHRRASMGQDTQGIKNKPQAQMSCPTECDMTPVPSSSRRSPAACRPARPEGSGPPRSRSVARRRCASPGSPNSLIRSAREVGQHQDVEQLGAGSSSLGGARRASVNKRDEPPSDLLHVRVVLGESLGEHGLLEP